MKFNLEIQCDNASFGEDAEERGIEVASILRDAADHLEGGAQELPLFDINGNRVGTATYVEG